METVYHYKDYNVMTHSSRQDLDQLVELNALTCEAPQNSLSKEHIWAALTFVFMSGFIFRFSFPISITLSFLCGNFCAVI